MKLFRYPCTQPSSAFKENKGHSSHVTRVVFSADDHFLISVGGNDKTVLVWETDFAAGKSAEDPNDDLEVDEDSGNIEEDLVDQSRAKK